MAMKKSGNPRGYNKKGNKINDPNRAKFVAKYLKENTKSADRPATKKQARIAYYLTSVDDKKGARGERKMARKTKTTAGPSSMRMSRADGYKAGSSTRAKTSSKEKRVAGPSTRAKTSSKVPRSAPKPTGARDRNRRTY